MNKKLVAAITMLAAAAVGCTSTPTFKTGEDAELTHDGLSRMKNNVMDTVWARKDIDLTQYSKVMFEGVGVEYREVSGPSSGQAGSTTARRSGQSEFRLDAETRALFEEEIDGAFQEEMARSQVFEVVDEPGPEVLLVRGALLDVVSRVPPETIGRSRIYIDSVGEATLVLEVRSSVSNTIYARAVDRRAAQSAGQMRQSNRVNNRAEVRRLGRRWGTMLREALDTLLTEGLQE